MCQVCLEKYYEKILIVLKIRRGTIHIEQRGPHTWQYSQDSIVARSKGTSDYSHVLAT